MVSAVLAAWRRCLAVLLALLVVTAPAAADTRELRLVTTTTTDNSGLIAYLVPAFEAEHGYDVKVIAVGTGRALELLARGDVDIALTHSRQLELEFVAAGRAVEHHPVMFNDFVIVGPPTDPAGIAKARDIESVFRALARGLAPFLSRGDRSGTHVRERELWAAIDVEPAGGWYRETGQGMGRTLQMAGELDAYTLSDRGTWLAFHARLPLALLFQGSDKLFNQYSVLSANPALHPHMNAAGAQALNAWLRSPRAKQLIRDFRIDGQSLFVPVL